MTDGRQDSRYIVRLPCRVDTPEFSISAQIVDLSASGARLQFPFLVNAQDLWALTSIQIEAIGRFEAEARWQSGNILGLSFASGRGKVQEYLERTKPAPVARAADL